MTVGLQMTYFDNLRVEGGDIPLYQGKLVSSHLTEDLWPLSHRGCTLGRTSKRLQRRVACL